MTYYTFFFIPNSFILQMTTLHNHPIFPRIYKYALLLGLMHNAVLRLRNTWDRVPEKYSKLLDDLQGIMDPSRNFSKYR